MTKRPNMSWHAASFDRQVEGALACARERGIV
jgi:hypothetical protein